MFREVLPAVVDKLRSLSLFKVGHEVTVIRDIKGHIRLVVGTSDPATAPLPSETLTSQIETALRQHIGSWLATPAIWKDDSPAAGSSEPKDPKKQARHLALELVRTQRQKAPWEPKAQDPSWFLLERHTAKRAWVGEATPSPPWPIDDVNRDEADLARMPPVITFFSHKGGVGRTTALLATALHLARAGQKVAVVDLDIEAPGLASLFFRDPPSAGCLDYLLAADPSASMVREVTVLVADKTFIGNGAELQVVTAGGVDDAFLEMLARIDLQDAGAGRELAKRINQLFTELQASAGPLDFILVDARAGLHEVAGLMLAGLCHGAVVVGTNSPQSWLGVTQVAKLLSGPYQRDGKDPLPLLLVHGMAPPATDNSNESETKRFQEIAYDELSKHYYPRDQVPNTGAGDESHRPIVIPYTAELRGGGGLLTAPVVDVLLGKPYRELAKRLGRQFDRPLKATEPL